MANRIAPIGMFHTPADMDELMSRIEDYSDGGERAAFTMGLALAWNLAAKLTAENANETAAPAAPAGLG